MAPRNAVRVTPWFAPPARRIRFFHEFKRNDPNVRIIEPRTVRSVHPREPDERNPFIGGFVLRTSLTPTCVSLREIDVAFSLGKPDVPCVLVDGPTDSPHRYKDGSLCMWFPNDPPEARWRPVDGPGLLLGHIAAHLMKEHLYRISGEWPGDEIKHVIVQPKTRAR